MARGEGSEGILGLWVLDVEMLRLFYYVQGLRKGWILRTRIFERGRQCRSYSFIYRQVLYLDISNSIQ